MSIVATQAFDGFDGSPQRILIPDNIPGTARIAYLFDGYGVDLSLRQTEDATAGIRIPADAQQPFPVSSFYAANAPRWLTLDPADDAELTIVWLPDV